MPEGHPPSLNPVPRSLLDQFLQELADLGLTDKQVEGHLVFLRLWQKFLQPQRLLDATPGELSQFEGFMQGHGVPSGEIRFALETVEHFYAFTLDRHPTWEERDAWAEHLAEPPETRQVPMWEAIAKKFVPHLKRVDTDLIKWRRS